MAKKPDPTPEDIAAAAAVAAVVDQAAADQAAKEKAEADDFAFTQHIRRLQNEAVAVERLRQLSLKDPVIAALVNERDTLKARVAELESQLSGKPAA